MTSTTRTLRLIPVALHVAPALAQAPSLAEKDAFMAAKELGTIEGWEAFLTNYPTGFHADLARAYVKRMAETPAATKPSAPAAAADYPMTAGTWGGVVRAGPGQNHDKVASLREGEEVVLMGPGVPVLPNDYPWFKIAFGDGQSEGYMWGGILCSTGVERPDLFKLCTFTPVRAETQSDHGPTPEQTCKDAGMDYNGSECVARKAAKPSPATVERRAKAACVDMGMIYLNGKCAPKKKVERDRAAKNRNKACPAGMYRNPYGQCQPNETGG
jgi:hypothetical protein